MWRYVKSGEVKMKKSVYLNYPTIEEGGRIRGILPNRVFAKAIAESQKALAAGNFLASLCLIACAIEAMVCHAAEYSGWNKPIRDGKRQTPLRSAFRHLQGNPGLNPLKQAKAMDGTPTMDQLEDFLETRNEIFHEFLRRNEFTRDDRLLLTNAMHLMIDIEGCLFSGHVGSKPGTFVPDNPDLHV